MLASFTIFGRIGPQLELLITSVMGRTHQGNLLGLESSVSEFTNSVSLIVKDLFQFSISYRIHFGKLYLSRQLQTFELQK